MFKSCGRSVALALAWLASSASLLLASPEVTPSHIDTYTTADGTRYFALSLAPRDAVPQSAGRDVVILFDTSASQTSLYRDKALSALDSLVQGLNRSDRLQLLAVDLEAVPLTESFVVPGSPEADQAVVTLKQRIPLGATDMVAALRSAAARFEKSDNDRVVIYIGDGMSTAYFMDLDEYRKLTSTLADQHIPVSSYAVGPRIDAQFVASLANLTGGMLVVDGESVDPKQAGAYLANAAHGGVLWPRAVLWNEALTDVYPKRLPPLRSDRDTIVIGKASDKLPAELKVAFAADAAGNTVDLDWTLAIGDSNPDFAFLTSLVESSQYDDGLRLVTLGTPGLKETQRLTNENTELLAKLSGQAVAVGNLEAADRLADEALRRDPQDETATSVKKQVAKLRAEAKDAAEKSKDAEADRAEKQPAPGTKKTTDARTAPAAKRGFQAFAVPEDLRLGPQSVPAKQSAPAKSSAAAPKSTKSSAKQPATAKAAKPGTAATSKTPAKSKPQAIDLKISAGQDPEVAWNDYLANHPDVKADAIRETVRVRMHERKFADVIGLIRASLRAGKPQPWMYEAMALAMQAGGSSKAEIERALMSGVDFGDSPEDLLYVAQYMARSGLEKRALKVFRQVAMVDPLRPEPYLFGLHLAQRTGDLEGIKWSSLGILKQAWPKDKQDVVQSAARAAAGAIAQLKSEDRTDEAEEFQAELNRAKIRDCVVKVSWTGDADVDLLVQEPSGAMASFRTPRTTGGGILVSDAAKLDSRGATESHSEVYECPEAFNGNYKVLVRRVWGKLPAGKVTVDVFANYGTPQQKHVQQQIALADEDAKITFDLDRGRRQEPLSEHLLAKAITEQANENQAILAQQVGSMASASSAGVNLGRSRQGLFGVPFVQQAVGYMPIIITLPAGASMSVNGVVSHDRRYVRISPSPFFSGIGAVTTFNMSSGSTGTSTSGGSGQPVGNNPGTSGGGAGAAF